MITTSVNRVKQGKHWCEDADEIAAQLLIGTEYTNESEIPISWIAQHCGLANTLLSLGAVRPRFQPKADVVLLNYARYLYSEVRKYAIEHKIIKPDCINVPHWIGNPDRKQANDKEYQRWFEEWAGETIPISLKIYQVMTLLFSRQPLVLKAVHGTKFYLSAHAIKYGFKEADVIKQALKTYLVNQLEQYNA